MDTKNRPGIFWFRAPVYGIGVFVLLYCISSFLYPGGSQADKTASGFSWLNNYWCDLLDATAKNGLENTGRPVAIVSWFILCMSLALFWYFLPLLLSANTRLKSIIRYCGLAAMLIALPLFTSWHDWVIQVAGFFGLLALIATYISMYKSRLYGFLYTGLFCFLLMTLNYFIMMSGLLSKYLPFIQKITFAAVLFWIIVVSRKLVLRSQQNTERRFIKTLAGR